MIASCWRKTLFFVLILRLSYASSLPSVSEIVSLTSTPKFDAFISHTNYTFVKFYHPSCPHCQAIKKPYEKLSVLIFRHNQNKTTAPDSRISMAMVDASEPVNDELLRKHSLAGFPTLKLYRKGRLVVEYEDGPTTADMFAFLISSTSTSLKSITHIKTQSEFTSFLLKSGVRPVIFSLSPPPDEVLTTIHFMRSSVASRLVFATVADSSFLTPNASDSRLKILLARHGRTPILASAFSAAEFTKYVDWWFPAIRDGETISSFLHAAFRTPHFTMILSELNAKYVLNAERPMLLAFGAKEGPDSETASHLAEADTERPHLLPIYIQAPQFLAFADLVGVNLSNVDDTKTEFVIYRTGNMNSWKNIYPGEEKANFATWLTENRQFVNDTMVETRAGIVNRFDLVALENAIKFDGRGILLLTRTEKCRKCRNYERIMNDVAKKLALHAGFIIVASVDAEHGLPDIKEVKGLNNTSRIPSVMWVAASETVAVYDGAMTAAAISRFARIKADVPNSFENGIIWSDVFNAYAIVIGVILIVMGIITRRRRRRYAKRAHVK